VGDGQPGEAEECPGTILLEQFEDSLVPLVKVLRVSVLLAPSLVTLYVVRLIVNLKFGGEGTQAFHNGHYTFHKLLGRRMVTDSHTVVVEANDEFYVWGFAPNSLEDIRMSLAHHLQGFDTSISDDLEVHLFEKLVIAPVKAYPASSSGHRLTLLSLKNEGRPSCKEIGGQGRIAD
jgi:hypothetical protein